MSISIDIGGTFTDCVVKRGQGDTHIFKAPSTPDAYEQGFMETLHLAAAHFGCPLEAFLAETDPIVHGSTLSTNALVDGKTGRAGLIVTKEHPHILLLREGPRKRSFDWTIDYPEPTVKGPCVIEEETTTILLLPNMQAAVTLHGDYLVTVEKRDLRDLSPAAEPGAQEAPA